MTKKERIEALIAHYSDGKNGAFAAYIGVAASTISTWLARDTYDPELLFAKCEGISASWLLSGEGNMLQIQNDEHIIADLRDTIRRQQREIDGLYERIDELKRGTAPQTYVESA